MKIKNTPNDFIVEEISSVKLDNDGEYTYFKLKKKNWTTSRAIQQIARRLRVSKKRFGFAGNKDKNAVTSQLISIWKTDPESLKKVKLKDIKITVLGKGTNRINLGDLKGNKFKIKIINASKSELKNLNKNFDKIKKNGFLNLFGEQRFGSAGNSHIIGKYIIEGNLEQATKEIITKTSDNKVAKEFSEFAKKNWGKWKEITSKCPKFLGIEKSVLNWLIQFSTDFGGAIRTIPKPIRRIFIHAYQSYIWNKEVEKLIKHNKIPKKLKIPAIECKRMPELSTLGTSREVLVKPKYFRSKIKDNIIILNFQLPKGAYATTLITQLFKN